MDKDKQNLYVFGYGISILVPFILFYRHISHHHLTHLDKGWRFAIFLGLFIAILVLLTKIKDLKPYFNSWILAAQAGVVCALWQGGTIHYITFFFLATAIIFMTYTLVDVEKLRPVYDGWMWVAHKINWVITTLVLGIMYFGVFSPVGIFFKIKGTDHLDRAIDKEAPSYWLERPKKEFNPEQCTKQF